MLGLSVDLSSRRGSAEFYHDVYVDTYPVEAGWTGDVGRCKPGTTRRAFRDAVALHVNYFRAMAGVRADVTFTDEYNRKAQHAALMMAANGMLSHSPDASWRCYTAAGAEGAGRSNLASGASGPGAVSAYMRDDGESNYFVGHRRWVLDTRVREMGTGDVWGFNALFVVGTFGKPGKTRDPFVAWPPPGYVPYQVEDPRWSFTHPDSDVSKAKVAMTNNGKRIPVEIVNPIQGQTDNTLVWEPEMFAGRPTGDTRYTVTVSNVLIGGKPRSFTYDVILFDPPHLCQGLPVTIAGTPDNDILRGTPGRDVIHGRGGNDVIRGLGGNDVICGGHGNDIIYGGMGADTLDGGMGLDVLRGGRGNDVLRGGPGADQLRGGSGNDKLWGGEEADILSGGPGHDVLRSGTGTDQVRGGSGNDKLFGGPGSDVLRGNRGDDSMQGGPGADEMFGGFGNDVLRGNKGNDWLHGGPGTDVLSGDEGDDSLKGGPGADQLDGGPGRDTCSGGLGTDTGASCETMSGVP